MDLKINDLSQLLGVCETTIRRWIAENEIPVYRINHQYRFSRMEIEKWLMDCKLNGKLRDVHLPDYLHAVEENEVVGSHKFALFRAIHKGALLFDVPGTTKDELIHNAIAEIAKTAPFDAEAMTELFLDREKLMPTALQNGVAIPHTRDLLIEGAYNLVYLVFSSQAIDFGALDGKPVDIFFFLFTSDDKIHLHLLAKIAYLVSDPSSLEALRGCKTKEGLLTYLKKWEGALGALYAQGA